MRTIDALERRLCPSAYQIWVLRQNAYKYNLGKTKRYGTLIYAPYKCNLAHNFPDVIEKIFLGPRADLIGIDRMLVSNQRGIKPHKFI